MRLITLLSFSLLILACNGPEATTSTTRTAPDRAAAAADGAMRLTASAIEPKVVFEYEDILWGFSWLPDGRIVATDKAGKLLIVDKDGKSKTITEGMPAVKNVGQGGLLDILPAKDFATSRRIYFTYSQPADADNAEESDANTAVGYGTLNAEETAIEGFKDIYAAGPKTGKPYHYGSRMVWGPNDGMLYFTIGDRGDRDINPQDTTRDGGKVYRITAEGEIPTDNPLVGVDGTKTAIYSWGHRNPQSLTVHPETGAIWETEHGPRGGDEINVIEPGKNYGWPVISYGINYSGSQFTELVAKDGMEQPVHYWVPSIAPSGMAFVTGNRYPGWAGDLMVGSLKYMRLQHVQLDGTNVLGEQKLINNMGRVRDVRMGPDDYIYCSVEGEGIVRLEVK